MPVIQKAYKCVVLGLVFVTSGVLANSPIDFSAAQNKACFKLIEQKTTGNCRLHFTHASNAQLAFAPKDEVSQAFSRYFFVRSEFPTSFQQQEFALQFFNYSIERFRVRDSLNFIRSDDGTSRLSMTVLTSASGGYAFVLAETDTHARQIITALQQPKARPATHYHRNIAKLFAQ